MKILRTSIKLIFSLFLAAPALAGDAGVAFMPEHSDQVNMRGQIFENNLSCKSSDSECAEVFESIYTAVSASFAGYVDGYIAREDEAGRPAKFAMATFMYFGKETRAIFEIADDAGTVGLIWVDPKHVVSKTTRIPLEIR